MLLWRHYQQKQWTEARGGRTSYNCDQPDFPKATWIDMNQRRRRRRRAVNDCWQCMNNNASRTRDSWWVVVVDSPKKDSICCNLLEIFANFPYDCELIECNCNPRSRPTITLHYSKTKAENKDKNKITVYVHVIKNNQICQQNPSTSIYLSTPHHLG